MGKDFKILLAIVVIVINLVNVSMQTEETQGNVMNHTNETETSSATQLNASDTQDSQNASQARVSPPGTNTNSGSTSKTNSPSSSSSAKPASSSEETDKSQTTILPVNEGKESKTSAVTQSNEMTGGPTNDDGVLIVPKDEGWLSKFGLKDQKVVISILIPVAGGVFGALAIVTVVYCIRRSRYRRRRVQRRRLIGTQDLSSTDHVMLLADSSEDEF
ncbi:uncharacterized protein LOC144453295 [Glandiceps talaboti]